MASSRDRLGRLGLLAPWLGGVPGVPGMPTPPAGDHPRACWRPCVVATGGFQVDSPPVGPGSRPGSPDGLIRVVCPHFQGAWGPVKATAPRANPPSHQPYQICLRSDKGRDIYLSSTPASPTYILTWIPATGCDPWCGSQARRSDMYISANG